MHNNIMAAGSKERPPMLGPGRYSQWRSRFLRYIDTKPNGEGLRKSILSGPYVPSTVLVQAVAATEGVPAVQQHTTIETVLNMTPENKEHFLSKKEAIFLLLTGIGDEIYSTIEACKTVNEMWIAIEWLQQGESLNVQDVKTNMFWEFGKFTSHDGESMESYYSRKIVILNKRQRDKRICKDLALLAKYFKRLYKPTNNNLRTSSNSRNKTEDTIPSATKRGIQCLNLQGFGHYANGMQEAKRVKTTVYKKKMLMSQQAEKEVLQKESSSTEQPLEQVQNNDENNVFANERQHSENNTAECADERAALANLIANLTLDTEENKTIFKAIKESKTHIDQELEECKTTLMRLGSLQISIRAVLSSIRKAEFASQDLCVPMRVASIKLGRNLFCPYVKRMIPEPGDADRGVPVNETFHELIDDELTEKKLKQVEADDQAIQTILLGLPEDIYATVDSCETAQEIWLHVQQMMKGFDIGIQEKKAKLFNEWERFTYSDGELIESYYHHFSKLMNDFKRNKHFPEKIASNLKLHSLEHLEE
ncbi:hypothetical protein Tco_0659208 [Tanacetum coccineum]